MYSLWFSSSQHICLSQVCLMSNARGSYCLVGFCFASKERQFLQIFSLSIAFFPEFFNLQGVFECVSFVPSSTVGILISFASYNAHVVCSVKGTVFTVHVIKAYIWSGSMAPLIRNLGAIWWLNSRPWPLYLFNIIAQWAPEPVRTFRIREESLVPSKIRTPDCQSVGEVLYQTRSTVTLFPFI